MNDGWTIKKRSRDETADETSGTGKILLVKGEGWEIRDEKWTNEKGHEDH